jgi:hypothetical protein
MAKAHFGRKPIQFFVECDERSGSLYNGLLIEAPFMARQGRLIISIKTQSRTARRRKAPTARSKKTTGS